MRSAQSTTLLRRRINTASFDVVRQIKKFQRSRSFKVEYRIRASFMTCSNLKSAEELQLLQLFQARRKCDKVMFWFGYINSSLYYPDDQTGRRTTNPKRMVQKPANTVYHHRSLLPIHNNILKSVSHFHTTTFLQTRNETFAALLFTRSMSKQHVPLNQYSRCVLTLM